MIYDIANIQKLSIVIHPSSFCLFSPFSLSLSLSLSFS